MIRTSSFINVCLCLSSIKLLFLKSYVSTDFDVHRNWMAITYNLNIKDWYYDTTSEWTLDYPPLFAAFEFLWALLAHLLNLQDALNLTSSSIRTESIVVYQKVTVILSDFVYYYAVYKLCNILEVSFRKISQTTQQKKKIINQEQEKSDLICDQSMIEALFRPNETSCIAWLLLLQPGLLLVDHIHFQYNGFLSGVFLLSLASIISDKFAAGAFWFSILINLKHIYLYCAPAYGMYTLIRYCLAKVDNQYRIISFIKRAIQLAMVVVTVFVITYSPFAEQETLKQIVARLFPFKRGLTHAYWAPNIWSLYNTADKILATIFKESLKVKFDLDSISGGYRRLTSTSGLVQQYEHQYLPTVEPLTTFILVAIFTIPLIIKFLFRFNQSCPFLFVKAVTVATFTSFMFGWHVHEKAIILVLLPMIVTAYTDINLRPTFLRLTLAGTYSLFPLLYLPAEYLIKLTILIAYYSYARSLMSSYNVAGSNGGGVEVDEAKGWFVFFKMLGQRLYNLLDKTFLVAIILIEAYITLVHGRLNYDWNTLAKLNKFEFLPLMLTSSLSAAGITFSYLELYYHFVIR